MYIKKVRIQNFKRFSGWFELDLMERINILVGCNEVGKSTIIEAINLALTGFYHGRYIRNNLSQHLFNASVVGKYIKSIKDGSPIEPPSIIIELLFDNYPEMVGNHNSGKIEGSGLYFKICFDEKYKSEYDTLIKSKKIYALPIEYYHVVWRSFHREDITSRSIKFKSSLIDTAAINQTAADMYVSYIIRNKLSEVDRIKILQSYRKAQQDFITNEPFIDINKKLSEMANFSEQKISLSVDLSSCNVWEDSLTAYMDEIPFHHIGKGTQCIIKTKLALAKKESDDDGVVLIEEPENHLSFGNLNKLISFIKGHIQNKQILISTHSSFVLNKLGLNSLILLSQNKSTKLSELSHDTHIYFEKLAGYDTLRMLLCKRLILVEGDSDELVVQRAYKDTHGSLPIEDSIDILCVRGLAFLRFLEIAKLLNLNVSVVTDNDGNINKLKEKYKKYLSPESNSNIKICYDQTIDSAETFGCSSSELPENFNYNTLEPKLLKENNLECFNKIFETTCDTTSQMLSYMYKNKGIVALKIFNSSEQIAYPEYIKNAINE